MSLPLEERAEVVTASDAAGVTREIADEGAAIEVPAVPAGVATSAGAIVACLLGGRFAVLAAGNELAVETAVFVLPLAGLFSAVTYPTIGLELLTGGTDPVPGAPTLGNTVPC